MSSDQLTVIIPAAGIGRRMKSYGPKSLIKIGNSTIIKNQISLLQTYIPDVNIVLVCGFKAERLMNETPDYILKIENERYAQTNVVRSIGMGLRVAGHSSRVIVVYGDLVFNSEAIKNISLNQSCIVVTDQGMGEEEVGCVMDRHHILTNLMYDLPSKWGQIAFFKNKELDLLKQMCWDDKNSTKFGFEIINQIVDKGGQFKCIHNDKIKIIDIDSSKDIQKAREILL
jgi:choline kinase